MATRQPTHCMVDYCNDVFGYLPSLCILQEGSYEGVDTIVYAPLPGPFAPLVKKLVVDKVHDLFRKERSAEGQSKEARFAVP